MGLFLLRQKIKNLKFSIENSMLSTAMDFLENGRELENEQSPRIKKDIFIKRFFSNVSRVSKTYL